MYVNIVYTHNLYLYKERKTYILILQGTGSQNDYGCWKVSTSAVGKMET